MTILPPVVQTLKNMKGIIYSAILILLHTAASAQESNEKENIVMFWNIENFFDFKDEGKNDSDREFSPEGERRWTGSRFYAKCNAIAKTVLWIKDIYGNIPDVAGFAEVENLFVLKSIINSGPLKKSDYRIVHYDSSDPRGIDVALIYRNDIFEKTASKPCRITNSSGDPANTRDILCVTLKNRKTGHLTAFIVNHHPSKFSGASSSRPKRETAMRRLKSICDSIRSEHTGIDIVAMGDFNDTPDNGLFSILEDNMTNMSSELYCKGEGTIRYKGRWDLIDMFIVSNQLAGHCRMSILYPPFLMTADRTYGGLKPLRTYSGPKYEGGVSDHCPIILQIGLTE